MENKPAVQNKKHPKWAWLWFVLSLIYTVSPIDLIPDTFPFVGWIDDLTLIGASTLNLIEKYNEDTQESLSKILSMLKWIWISLGVLILLILILIASILLK